MSNKFKDLIRKKRKEDFPGTFDIVHDSFLDLKLDSKDSDYFFNNASEIVETLRSNNWNTFLKHERIFSENLYNTLIREDVNEMNPKEAVEDYIHKNVQNFYDLSLSNTQSRRTRAGNEFEAIISHLFMGANLPFNEQGLIGTGVFSDKNLAKLVDHVVPGAIEYNINKRNTITISAKTTLRERWQQIGDEMQRTRMPEMYLATLDENIGSNTLDQLRANNIYPVTTQTIKNEFYANDNLVITFEELLIEANKKVVLWEISDFNDEQIKEQTQLLTHILNQHSDKPYVVDYINNRLDFFE